MAASVARVTVPVARVASAVFSVDLVDKLDVVARVAHKLDAGPPFRSDVACQD